MPNRPDQVDEEGLHFKYRVFKEPEDVEEHPVGMTAYYIRRETIQGKEGPIPVTNLGGDYPDPIGYAKEVHEFIFPLKPDSDHHARVALAAYAWSVREEKRKLSDDLFEVLDDLE